MSTQSKLVSNISVLWLPAHLLVPQLLVAALHGDALAQHDMAGEVDTWTHTVSDIIAVLKINLLI